MRAGREIDARQLTRAFHEAQPIHVGQLIGDVGQVALAGIADPALSAIASPDRSWRVPPRARRANRRCERSPRGVFLSMARKRTKKGRWGVWYLVSNRDWLPASAAREYARRWNCESGFRDAKSVLGFSEARIEDLDAWARMFALVAIALLVLIRIGGALVTVPEYLSRLLRRVRSRRRARSELSLVRAIAEMLKTSSELWEWLIHRGKLNLETAL